jgi:tetratricopeptide (TPR) repeat protein
MVAQLEEARMKAVALSRDFNRNDPFIASDRAYAAAFAELGLDVTSLPTEEVARKIRTSAIHSQLVSALDHWAYVKGRLPDAKAGPLSAVAQLADDNPWRQRLRDPKVAEDQKTLQQLAEEDGILDQPPASLLILSSLLKTKNAPAAQLLLRRAQQRYPADFRINFDLGMMLSFEKKENAKPAEAAEAVGFFRAALVVQPQSPYVYIHLANALGTQGLKYEPDAEAACRKAIELNSNFAEAYFFLSNGLAKQKRLPEAEKAIRKAIELEPDTYRARFRLGDALSSQRRFREAEAAYLEAIRLEPESSAAEAALRKEIELKLGVALFEQQKWSELEVASRRALKRKSDDAEAHANLGLALHGQEKFPEAEAAHLRAIELKPDFAFAHYHLGHSLIEQKNLPEAIAAYRKAIDLHPTYVAAFNSLGLALVRQNKFSDAEGAFHRVTFLAPDWDVGYLHYGLCLEEQGKLAEAVAAFRKSIDLNPQGRAKTYDNLGRALVKQKNFREAEAAFRELGKQRPSGEAFANLAVTLSLQQKHREAIAACRKALEIQPDLVDAYYNGACAAVLAACGQGDGANLDAKEHAHFHSQARAWLRVGLTIALTELEKEPAKANSRILQQVRDCQEDPDFAGVRGQALAKLPEAEREHWRILWEEVADLERRAAATQPRRGKSE